MIQPLLQPNPRGNTRHSYKEPLKPDPLPPQKKFCKNKRQPINHNGASEHRCGGCAVPSKNETSTPPN
ncbi:MAG: hypothetical protein ABSE15_12295 [Candidatus Bathyarchaeia archaeon]